MFYDYYLRASSKDAWKDAALMNNLMFYDEGVGEFVYNPKYSIVDLGGLRKIELNPEDMTFNIIDKPGYHVNIRSPEPLDLKGVEVLRPETPDNTWL